MAAALAAYQAGVKDILLIERDQYLGGILNQCIHPGFGLHHFKTDLTGPEYADRFIKQVAAAQEIEVSLRSFVVRLTADRELTYLKPGGMVTLQPRALIMATGCRERTREMIHIAGTRPAGIFPAGLAQKMVNIEGWLPGKEIVVIGSGDIGLIMARRFTLEGARVKAVVEIQKESRGLVRNVVQCLEDFQIPLYLNHRVALIHGRDRVEKVTVENNETKETFELTCDTVLVSVGLIPENELIEQAGSPDPAKPNLPGLFVCGNSLKVYDLVDNVTRDSQKAGEAAAEYLKNA
ncbi:MAG: NAD(P)/FAD-dependent oxidoreductase [Candidatus Margulisbacteria bacterium]|jgi:NADPH-dependent 2,4-dienoyl-CoA reductase/sulfur reductase-like enzyme|nr:NAD(P)/FAD-dependent oxidoreductase [Candidatus Margulisiibacteriota bacterium]